MSITNAGPVALKPQDDSAPILALFERALAQDGGSVDSLTKLVDLYERMQKRKAELEFSLAFSKFQHECPAIQRTSEAKIATRGGTEFRYTYADLEELLETTGPPLHENGFSISFDTGYEKGLLTCFFTLRHVGGHHIRAQFPVPTDSSAAMSEQQKMGAALTYAKRQVLIAALGLALTEPDPDKSVDPTPVSEEQVENIYALLRETKANFDKFVDYFGIARVEDLKASDYRRAIVLLEKKRKAIS